VNSIILPKPKTFVTILTNGKVYDRVDTEVNKKIRWKYMYDYEIVNLVIGLVLWLFLLLVLVGQKGA